MRSLKVHTHSPIQTIPILAQRTTSEKYIAAAVSVLATDIAVFIHRRQRARRQHNYHQLSNHGELVGVLYGEGILVLNSVE